MRRTSPTNPNTSNVVELRPKAMVTESALADVAGVLAQARDLLHGTKELLFNVPEIEADSSHLASIEKIKALLQIACDERRGNEPEDSIGALALVELARVAFEAGEESFKGGETLTYRLTVAEALVCALERLGDVDAEPSDEDPIAA